MDSDDFDEDITLKPYLKYKYQKVSTKRPLTEKIAFLKTINGSKSDYVYGLNPLKEKGSCYFHLKKGTL